MQRPCIILLAGEKAFQWGVCPGAKQVAVSVYQTPNLAEQSVSCWAVNDRVILISSTEISTVGDTGGTWYRERGTEPLAGGRKGDPRRSSEGAHRTPGRGEIGGKCREFLKLGDMGQAGSLWGKWRDAGSLQ